MLWTLGKRTYSIGTTPSVDLPQVDFSRELPRQRNAGRLKTGAKRAQLIPELYSRTISILKNQVWKGARYLCQNSVHQTLLSHGYAHCLVRPIRGENSNQSGAVRPAHYMVNIAQRAVEGKHTETYYVVIRFIFAGLA